MLTDLPPELLHQVYENLPELDRLSCSTTCHHLRQTVASFVFAAVSIPWAKVPEICEFLYKPCIAKLSIRPSDKWAEWHESGGLATILTSTPHITAVGLTLSSSGSWIKYMPAVSTISKVEIVSQLAVTRRTFTDNSTVELPLCDMGDVLRAFPMVTELTLEGVTVRFDEIVDNQIRSISLLNCVWDYPFDFGEQFARLDKLAVRFTKNYSALTHLERVKSLCVDPPSGLTEIAMEFDVGHMQKSWHPFAKSCPTQLAVVKMAGFQLPNDRFFDKLAKTVRRVEIEVATPDVVDVVCKNDKVDVVVKSRLEKPGITHADLKY